MHVYLISPRNPESFWTFDRILPVLGKRCVFPNLALPTLAGLTPPGNTVTLCDENVEDVDLDVEADLIGITGFIVHRERMFELCAAFRARGKRVAVGGPYATLCPEDFRGRADVLFVGEAEETWPRFLEDLAAGREQREYHAPRLPEIAENPLPRFELLRVGRYRTMTMQFARGCPFTCEFCDIIVMYGRKPRTKSVATALAEVEALHRLGVTNVFLVDDNFIGNRAVAKGFLRELIPWQRAHGFPIEFFTEVSLNVSADDELLGLLRDANFRMLFIGIESPRADSLLETKKTQNLRGDMLSAVHKVQEYGFQVDAGMIVGFDADDPTIFEEQFRFIQDARIPISMTGLLNAVPKTPLHARLKQAGRLLSESTGDQFVFTNIVPGGMSRLELYEGYRRLLRRLYDPDNFRARASALLRARGEARSSGFALRAGELGLLGRFVRECLLRAPAPRRRMTLRLLGEIALRRPKRLRDAIALSLMHKHFHEYVESLDAPLERLCDELREKPAAA